jgi:hypothetical protein
MVFTEEKNNISKKGSNTVEQKQALVIGGNASLYIAIYTEMARMAIVANIKGITS